MMNYSDLNSFDSLQFMPVRSNKLPIAKDWQKSKQHYDLGKCEAVGLVCGKLSGNLEAIDIDTKYDLTGNLYASYKRLIHEIDPNLLAKLVVQSTKSGGFHFIYRCAKIDGNLKLANRPTTEDERKSTFDKSYKQAIAEKKDEAQAVNEATKAAKNDTVRVLLETRGEGGYIMCYPSEGYKIIHGDYYSIAEITTDERETLINIARQFNQVVVEHKPAVNESKKQKGLSPFEDFNERGDVVALLQNHGWRIVRTKGRKTIFLRPGQTSSATSGDYDAEKKWFAVFTTSTQFDPQKAYLPYAVYAMLECEGNFSEASKKLYDAGYGDRFEKQQEINQKTPSRISLIDNDYSFLASADETEEYLEMARKGTLPMGLTTGMPALDKNFLFKKGSFVIINGFDNVGKTSVILFLNLLSAIFHGWRWIVYCAENSPGYCTRKLMEFYWNKSIKAMNELEYKIALKFIKEHFVFIKSEDELFNYKDLLQMTKKLQQRSKFDAVLIDPYNALKIELTNSSKLSTHEYHYEAISEVKQYTRTSGTGFYINTHAVTGASRLKSEDRKTTPAPGKADVEGGQKWANKADDFITIHRHVSDPDNWMITEMHIRKIKEVETGGKVTYHNDPVRLRMMKGGYSFCEDHGPDVEISPIEKWHQQQQKNQAKLIKEDVPHRKYSNDFLSNLKEDEDVF